MPRFAPGAVPLGFVKVPDGFGKWKDLPYSHTAFPPETQGNIRSFG
jgi:hypothetical protein